MFTTPSKTRDPHSSGFTLVEMLVSVAIVLLMMTMFAQIFQMATGSLSQQRGIAENDQRGRMVSATLRVDLEGRTFRDVFPFRASEDTTQLTKSLDRRKGYFEIDEGDPSDDTDDVLQFTADVRKNLLDKQASFGGKAQPFGTNFPLSGVAITGLSNPTSTAGRITVSNLSSSSSTDYITLVGKHVWIVGSTNRVNDGQYLVTSKSSTGTPGSTTVNVNPAIPDTAPASLGAVCLAESDPDFDDGLFGNGIASSQAAEICYYLRNGVLYRRILLIRDTGDSQPKRTDGQPMFWDQTAAAENYPTSGTATTSFWRDFDYSAFYFTGKITQTSPLIVQSPGIRFHTVESLNNGDNPAMLIVNETTTPFETFPISLGMPQLRFGHRVDFTSTPPYGGLPQGSSSTARLPGPDNDYGTADDVVVPLGRFNLQECANSAFGYPGYIPSAGNPFARTNLQVNPNTGLVIQYTDGPNPALSGQATPLSPGEIFRRGEDVLMSNVLSFDVKLWDPTYNKFVDLGDNFEAFHGPFSGAPPSPTIGGQQMGRVNKTYSTGPNHFRFDTWHPLATVGPGTGDNEPPYMPVGLGTDGCPGWAGQDDDGDGKTDWLDPPFNTLPDWKEVGRNHPTTNAASDDRPFALSAIQITINYRDVSSNQIRQVTIVQSLTDRMKPVGTTNIPPEE